MAVISIHLKEKKLVFSTNFSLTLSENKSFKNTDKENCKIKT